MEYCLSQNATPPLLQLLGKVMFSEACQSFCSRWGRGGCIAGGHTWLGGHAWLLGGWGKRGCPLPARTVGKRSVRILL